MSLRAVLIGLLLAAVIAGLAYINDYYICVNLFIGNHLPISVFGMLIVFMMAANPLLRRFKPSWALRPGELAVALCLTLVACSVPSNTLMRTFTPTLIMPLQHYQTTPGWRKADLMSYVPPQMLVNGGQYDVDIVGGFISGWGQRGKPISLDRIPWEAWRTPMVAWLPIVGLTFLMVICLSLIVHRQWASRERLRYPIADFAGSLIEQTPGRAVGPIFRDKLFWIGLGAILVIRIVNGLYVWFPQTMIQIPLSYDFKVLGDTFKVLHTAPGGGDIMSPQLFPTAVAFSFFLASDVGLSLGLTAIIPVIVGGMLVTAGVDTSGSYMEGGIFNWMGFGAYLGIALVLFYTGRRYYGLLAREAVTFRRVGETEPSAVWATRILIPAFVVMVVLLTRLGLQWPLAILAVLLTLLIFVVMARINAEAGMFLCKPLWQPPAVFIGLFGLTALGPKATIIIGMATMILTIEPRECLLPFLVNGLKMCDKAKVQPGRIGWLSVLVVAVALAVVIPTALWANYNYGLQEAGGDRTNQWATTTVPKFPFDAAERSVTKLKLLGQLEQCNNYGPLERIAHIQPDRRFLWSAAIGLALVLATSFLRLRYTWWPIHPVFFVVWGVWFVRILSASFLLGWAIKVAVTRLGGAATYQRTKKLMAGVIAGDLLGGLTFMVVNWIYYGVTGLMAETYRVFPG
jgi:hypothetical protein